MHAQRVLPHEKPPKQSRYIKDMNQEEISLKKAQSQTDKFKETIARYQIPEHRKENIS